MSLLSLQKREAARELVEGWGVPLHLLSQFSGLSEATLERCAAMENWQAEVSIREIKTRLVQQFEAMMDQLAQGNADAGFDEKRVRALAAMAKTGETIAALSIRAAHDKQTGSSEKGKKLAEPKSGLGSEDTLALDKQLESLIAGLA